MPRTWTATRPGAWPIHTYTHAMAVTVTNTLLQVMLINTTAHTRHKPQTSIQTSPAEQRARTQDHCRSAGNVHLPLLLSSSDCRRRAHHLPPATALHCMSVRCSPSQSMLLSC